MYDWKESLWSLLLGYSDRRERQKLVRLLQLKPGEEVARGIRRWREGGESAEVAVPQFIGGEGGTVGGDADETLACLPLPVGQITGELLFGGLRFTAEVCLELEDGVSEEGVRTSMDFRERTLEVNLGALSIKAVDEKDVYESPNLLVSRARQQLDDDLAKTILCNGHC